MENAALKIMLLNEQYEKLTLFGENNGMATWLVKLNGSNKLYVWKEIDNEMVYIYRELKEIKSSHLAMIYNIFEYEDKAVVIEEYISGSILADKIESGMVAKEEAYDYICQLLEVLSELEKKKIVHRDITPKNILISNDNVVKLIDFGISRTPKKDSNQDTRILGTVGYAAPEQFGFMQTDIRSDIYSVGVVFHEMLTGRLPEGNFCSSVDYKAFIQKCIDISPANRFQTVQKAYKNLTEKYSEDFNKRLNKNRNRLTYKTKNDIKTVEYDYSKLPGFRSGRLWKKIIAMCIYIFLIMVSVIGFQGCHGNGEAILLEVLAAFLYFFSCVVIAGNYLNWYNKVPFFKNMDSVVKMFIRVILSLLIFYAAIDTDIYVKNIMLK